MVKIWTLSSGETHTTLEGHTGSVTTVTFAPNGNFCVSGSEDTTCRVWGLKLGLIVSAFKEHQAKVLQVSVGNDSKKILSVDGNGIHRLWVSDSGLQLLVVQKPTSMTSCVRLNGNNVFAIGGKNDTR